MTDGTRRGDDPLRDPGLTGLLRGVWRILTCRPRVPPRLRDNRALRTVLERRSRRAFTDAPIADDAWAAILEAGRVAPSTVNLQTWGFVTFDRDRWRETFGQPLPLGGRRAVIVLADTHRLRRVLDVFPDSPLVEYTVGVINASLAAMNMTVAAEALGIGSVMLSETGRGGFLDTDYLAERLALPERVTPLMTIVFGHPRGPRPAMPPRLPLDQVAWEGRYREADQAVLEQWREQMLAGYKVSNRGASFRSQVAVYLAKIGRAEAELRARVLGTTPPAEDGPSGRDP